MRSFTTARPTLAALMLIGSAVCFPLASEGAPASSPATPAAKVVKPIKVASTAATPQAAPNPYGLNPQEAQFVDLVNKERTSRGLNALTVDPLLIQVARDHSAEMCKLNYFDHHSPTTGMTTPMDRYLKAIKDANDPMPGYLLVGENIYYCSTLDDHYNVEYGHQALMNSPGHRANILEPRFAKIGVGTYRDAKGEFWVTESFLCDIDPQAASVPSAPDTTTTAVEVVPAQSN